MGDPQLSPRRSSSSSRKSTPRKKSASCSDGAECPSSGHSSPRVRSDGSLSPHQVARLGLPHHMPPRLAAMIGNRTTVERDIGRLEQIIGILDNMQNHPETFGRDSHAVDMENMAIADILEGIENEEFLEYPVTFTTYGGRGDRYHQTWRLVGPTTKMHGTGRDYTQEHGLCEPNDALEDHMVGVPGTRFLCLCSTRGWDGTRPGERGADPYSGASVGWFNEQIQFLKRLIAELRRLPVTHSRARGQRRTRKRSKKTRMKRRRKGSRRRRKVSKTRRRK